MKKYLLLLVPSAAVLAWAGCGDTSHIFVARQYDEVRGCLGLNTSVDVVVGDLPPSCPVVCLTEANEDGGEGRKVWTSTMCEPYPYNFDAASTDPACAPALAAATRNDTCLDDGGSTRPIVDASADASDAGDASADASDADAPDASADAGDGGDAGL